MAMEKFDASEVEARIYKMWEEAGAFKAGANASRDETFCIQLPPPNVTGHLHVGHAFNHTLMDMLIRWKRMQGYDTLWQPGLDHAGIATQLMVEKELAETQQPKRTELGREKFLEKVWEWKAAKGGMIEQQARRLGDSLDWSRSAFTMSGAESAPATEKPGNFHDAVLKVFVEMYNKGLIYRGKRLVNWDPHFETAISDLEVENIEVDGHMWHFKYPLAGGETYEYVEKDEDGNVTLRETRDYISIATTRPETMLGDGAVAVHKDDERYAPIVGKLCEIPVGPKDQRRLIPIITDPYPDPDFGSGAVKITGAHDFNDYEVAKRGNIPMYSLMDTKGYMRADGLPYAEEAATAQRIAGGEEGFDEGKIAAMNMVPEDYRGLDRFEARKRVVADITAEGNAVMIGNPAYEAAFARDGDQTEVPQRIPFVENKKIMQPFGDRSKVVIEPMLTDQWFVDTAKIVGPALDAVREGRVTIMPESGEKVFYHWLENIEPWCISRQLWWGHQIPVWYGLDLGVEDEQNPSGTLDEVELLGLLLDGLVHRGTVMHCGTDLEAVKSAFVFDNADVPSPLSHASIIEVADKSEAIDRFAAALAEYNVTQDPTVLVYPVWRDPDVLDTWFSSGLWPFGTLGWPDENDPAMKYFPGDVLITGQDILFFWVARMMMMSQAVLHQDPFHTVYLHQLVRDAKGEKMSKTRGNVIDPLDMIDAYGADALRFSNAQMAALGGVLKISEDRIKGYRNFGTKLWNAFSFADHYAIPYPGDPEMPVVSQTLNKWIIGETGKVRETVDAALTAYRFNDASDALYAFTWGKVCDWYLEFSKPILQGTDTAAKAETEQTLRWVLDQCLVLLNPIMPFITEELWGMADRRAKMLIHADWPTYAAADLVDTDADREMNWVIGLIENVRSARAQVHVPAGAKVPLLVTGLDEKGQSAWDNNHVLIQRLARIESLSNVDRFPKGCVTVPMDGGTFGIPLEGLIDVDAEIARLEKTLQKLAKELGGLRGRLNNPKFAASAPEDVVAEARENLRLRETEESELKAAIARLQELG
ncbi:valine--tRNA ligase [Yoonia sediminilitoris]|uniref:Valine--tRNA ligase n=1 Tax=Yoonia sediminilitoris TaxID=1286148 RepID=A0A2T6KJP9_9RHOB|nr:valine--tRNA ligase [Yoonia sediminilitoris]PUB16175.1 valyl-tRNA synthetase [Yoonia sediminilitoris]RCW96524.1 valyl-tRNA synthetase [Yoonia sediminilitoris]